MIACAACGEENPERARFCLGCGVSLAAPAAIHEERRVVTALFTDIVGSTARAEGLDPEDVRARLGPYYACVRKELERFGGSVEKFIGDAVVALFGAPLAHEDDPERAVLAALAVRTAIAELNEEDAWLDLNIRTGINTGEALVVLGGAGGESEGMAAGDIMNTAARIQSAAPVNGILVGAATRAASKYAIEYRSAEPVAAKGKAQPVEVWEVVGRQEAVAARSSSDGALIGRDAELGFLEAAWREVCTSATSRLVGVVGPAGIGKSRLVAEFVRRAESEGRVCSGRCLPYGEGITYWPVVEIVRGAAGILRDDDEEAVSARLDGLIHSLATDDEDELRTIAATLANLVGVTTTPGGTYSAGDLSQAELHWGIRRFFELLAERPLVLVLEDLHWAEPTLLELVERLPDELQAPVLVVASWRPAGAGGDVAIAPSRRRRVLELETLSPVESASLAASILESEGMPLAAEAEHLLRALGGNPLFVEETVRMLIGAGHLDESGWHLAEGATVPVPSTLQALIASRFDQIGAAERRVAQQASVVGSVFSPDAVAYLGELEGDIDGLLQTLERHDILREEAGSNAVGDRAYAFRHILFRDVAYGQIPKGRRALLHLRCSEWLERLPGADDEFVEIAAYHLEQACSFARAVARSPVAPPVEAAVAALTRSGRKAERREGIREADRYYERALQLLDDAEREASLELRIARCRTRVALGDLREAAAELSAVEAGAVVARRSDLRCEALIALANIDGKQGRPLEARERLAKAAALAAETRDDRLATRARYESASLIAWSEGDVDPAIAELRNALALAASFDDRSLRIEGHMRLGGLLFNRGLLVEAEGELEQALALAGELGTFRDDARATSMLSFVRFYLGRLDEAERLALQALEWLERTCDSYLELQNLRALGKYALARGDAAGAEARLRGALPLALEIGGWLLVEIYRYLAEALVLQGRVDDAAEIVAFAARNLPDEDLYARAALLLAEAAVASARGERESVSVAFEETLRILENQHLVTDLAEARFSFGRALAALGETVGAQTELERARSAFRRMDAEGLVREIDRELAGLVGGAGAAGSAAPSAP